MNWEKIRKEFETSDITMADLAKKHKVKPTTLRSRKNRESWQRNATKGTTQRKGNDATQQSKTLQRDATQNKPKLVIDNDGLTDKQKLFCLLYLQYFNATKAYQEVYKVDYKSAKSAGNLLLTKVDIKEELTRLKAELQTDLYIDAKDILSEYVKQAYADVTDFLEFRLIEEPMRDMFGQVVIDGETGQPVIKRKNIVEFKDSEEVDGTLIQEVKMGKDGPSLKLMDKQRALDALMKYVDVDALKQAQLEKAQAEAVIAQDKANKLSADGKAFDLLESLFDVMQGGDGSGERK